MSLQQEMKRIFVQVVQHSGYNVRYISICSLSSVHSSVPWVPISVVAAAAVAAAAAAAEVGLVAAA